MAEKKRTGHWTPIKDISGQRFGLITAQRFIAVVDHSAVWLCLCDCGTEITKSWKNLARGRCKSCGRCGYSKAQTLKSNSTHGMTKTGEFRSWMQAKNRCFNPRCKAYPDYGGRGITMCPEWRDDFPLFLQHIGPRPGGMTLDRVDNNKGYEPGNVRWATRLTQSRNRRNVITVIDDGRSLSVNDVALLTGIKPETLRRRHRVGTSMFAPLRPGVKQS